VVIAPVRRAGDPGSIPGPGENFSLKLLIRIFLLTMELETPVPIIQTRASSKDSKHLRQRII